MDGLGIDVLLNSISISVTSGKLKDEHEGLCTMKRSNWGPRNPRSGALTARPRGRFNLSSRPRCFLCSAWMGSRVMSSFLLLFFTLTLKRL